MDANTIYAVVDIETTGTNVAEGNRMIQFGCVLVQNGQIINHFNTDVNPQTSIPQSIQALTGITEAQVKRAPLFDDVAGTIYSLLSDTVFVAHNVNFDFPFVNAELERVGYPRLEIQAIDTVTLSQILLPTVPSYRLHDLTAYLNIEHDHPHTANDDALVTGELLIVLFNRMLELPIVTLQQMVAEDADLPQDTADVFKWGLAEVRKNPRSLPDYLYVSHGIALRKTPVIRAADDREYTYPRTKKNKLKRFPKNFEWRADQAKMMNLVYRQYTDKESANQPLIVEAPTGTGKTLGYALPMAYLAQKYDKQVVIATDTVLLQNQLINQTMPLLERMLPFETHAEVVKGNAHYLDLSRFKVSLSQADHSKQTQLIKLRLLVWLTQTATGDLDELHFKNEPPYLDSVYHHGIADLTDTDPFFEDDFLRRLYQRLKYTRFIIVNHAFLIRHADLLGDNFHQPYLVVDEAQHLADYALKTQRQKFDFQVSLSTSRRLMEFLDPENEYGLTAATEGLSLNDDLKTFYRWLIEFSRQLRALDDYLTNHFKPQFGGKFTKPYKEIVISETDWVNFLKQREGLFEQLDILVGKFQDQLAKITDSFYQQSNRWLKSDEELFMRFSHAVNALTDAWNTLTAIRQAPQHEEAGTGSYLYWLTVSNDLSHIMVASNLMTVEGFLTQQVYSHFQAPTFTGATLFSSNRSQYLYDQLDLDRSTVKMRRLKSDFNFEAQAKMYISNDAPDIIKEEENYNHYVSQTLIKMLSKVNRPTLVLFNSLAAIESVYGSLTEAIHPKERLILAQGISGSKEKLIKRFMDEDNAVLLGAASFWEGIDLPQDKLQVLVIARLPFDSPDQLETKVQYERLKAKGKNPFYNLSLPKATLRLRQGIGRLIRTRQDYGAVIVLDSRLVTRHYGQTILKTLPASLPIMTGTVPQLLSDMTKFFKKHKSISHDS
ncbi:ATP-dependent helicase [Secundilactobacillus pentosiphilus]|uniref:3'-5' exonuclease DinG n=1 Tax=Secundilactobacillus pentosiphilus TaxID=1714682 RepID=A0A1Z5IVN8_9LACO|nr:helicase C-terminal domain-containing protein [Secundilactobacillus pentosiphilus]GAX05511.1 ATP-dependent helicase [Secundilactobacillus pentosiphilus]